MLESTKSTVDTHTVDRSDLEKLKKAISRVKKEHEKCPLSTKITGAFDRSINDILSDSENLWD